MPKRPEPPPELAYAIEFTPEFLNAMGLDEEHPEPDPVVQVPSDEELARIPEWYAVNAWITADEYLACFGNAPQGFTPIAHGLRGRLKRK
jgi:hypothetical protein